MRTRILSLHLTTIAIGLLIAAPASGQVAGDNVSADGIDGFQLLYAFEEVPLNANFSDGVGWDVDNSDTPLDGVAERIGVYYQLDDDWVWASLPAYTQDQKQMGFPEINTNSFFFQEVLSDLVVEAADDFRVTPGTFSQANIEIWPNNYGTKNVQGLPEGDADTYDFADERINSGSYGSFQIHNLDEAETVLAINQFNGGATYDTTIGNFEGGNPDATLQGGSQGFSDRILEIWVKPFTGLDGDFNLDGVVDGADLAVITGNLNEVGTTRETGDLNGDFETDLHDFILFRESFNASAPAAAAVPEPTTFGLACLALFGALSTRRRR